MIEAPCQYCEDRHFHCHSACDKYMKYKEKHNEEALKVRANKETDTFVTYGVERMRKIMRKL